MMHRFVAVNMAALMFAFATNASAEDTPMRDNVLTADLGSGVIGIAYERRATAWLSWRSAFQLNRPWYTKPFSDEESDVVGFGIEGRPFFFPLLTAPAGLYVSPFARVVAIRAQDSLPEPIDGTGLTGGITAGYGWLLLDDRMHLRFGAGVQYWDFTIEKAQGTAGLSGWYPDVDIMIGWAF